MTTFALSTAILKSLLSYEKGTGVFRWRVQRPNGVKPGDIAGAPYARGYIGIGVMGKVYLAHRLAWLYVTGSWPADQVDHKNTIKSDNRWKNLRLASVVLNGQNIRNPRRHNKTGFLGVHVQGGKFRAQIRVNYKPMFLGDYPTPELAHAAYLKAKRKYHAGCMI